MLGPGYFAGASGTAIYGIEGCILDLGTVYTAVYSNWSAVPNPKREGSERILYPHGGSFTLHVLSSEVNNPSLQTHKRDWAVSD
jgi:hypothetical protein